MERNPRGRVRVSPEPKVLVPRTHASLFLFPLVIMRETVT
jgi:hypothetical protein